MSINRDESTLGTPTLTVAPNPSRISLLTLRKQGLTEFKAGVYIGREEDITLFINETEMDEWADFRVDQVSPLFLGVVMEGCFKCYGNVRFVSHTGFRMGDPLFDISLLRADHCKRVESEWWTVPMWMACRLGLVVSTPGNKTPMLFDLRQVKG